MIGTYAAVLAVWGGSLAIGQAAVALCGVRRWSWLSPAVGLALLCAISWGTVRLPGGGATSALVVLVAAVGAVLFLRGRVEGAGEALRVGAPVALLALAGASLPFVVEGHSGILGTGFNPDMSQHLLASDRLSHDASSQLLHDGYPLGPHAIVVALHKGLGIGLVQGFSGLTMAVAVLASLTALAALADLAPLRRTACALLVGLPYLVASYFAQGAFKETIQALLVLAFALALREASRTAAWRDLPLRFIPAALIALGSVYAYSFPGLIWLAATAVIWVAAELALSRSSTADGAGSPIYRSAGNAARPALLASVVLLVGALPELSRMIDFGGFETFDPSGPGLGNLFGQVSPFEVLGIWPSGDFRVAPGDGAVPAPAFYVGAAFATMLLLHGLIQCWRRRETAVVAGLFAAAAIYAATRIGGTPYTAAKAIVVAAPLATLVIVLPLLAGLSPLPGASSQNRSRRFRGTALAAGAYLLAAGGCSLLALANAPVGPTSYSPALAELRPLLASGSTLVLASRELLEDQHGARYIAWELRGDRVCIEPERVAGDDAPPSGVRFVVTSGQTSSSGAVSTLGSTGTAAPPFAGLRLRRRAGPYLLWERRGPVGGPSPCPLVEVRQSRQGT